MTCASCSQVIEENVSKLIGVKSIQVNFATEKAELVLVENFEEQKFFELLNKLGYRAILPNKSNTNSLSFFDKTLFQSLLVLVSGVVSMMLAMGPMSKVFEHITNNFIQLSIASVVLFLFGKPYLMSVYNFIKTFHSNMNTLIGLGLLSAYGYSVGLMLMSPHAHVYFEGIPFILGFTIFGHFLEEKARTKAKSSLSALYKMQMKFASKVVDQKEINTAVVDLVNGDLIRIRPGDKISLDGKVIEGNSHCDESMISGESVALEKKSGDLVFAGSLNLEGSLLVEVTSELNSTFISDVVRFVEKAQMNKAPIQKYVDKIVHFFTPAIMIIAFVTFVTWLVLNPVDPTFQAFSHMISVLLIACPCALGLAVPMAVMLSTSEASQIGLLIGGGDVIERGSKISVVVFDKTGTLTEGKPQVESVISANAEKINEFYKIAASVAQYSNHPLAKAITQHLDSLNIDKTDPDKFKNIPGMGVVALVNGKKILMGSREFLLENNIQVDQSLLNGSHVYFSEETAFLGLFTILDPIKKDAKKMIDQLKKLNIKMWMLSGDNENVARSVADELGITNIRANCKPVDKANFILELKKLGNQVAMIGDGINDAPALTVADLSMAMSSGSDIAVETSDVSLLEGKIENIPAFFTVSRRTMKIIKENLFLSFVYNILCIPLAAGVFYPHFHLSLNPMWASLAMGLSSFSVILSSLRLKKSL